MLSKVVKELFSSCPLFIIRRVNGEQSRYGLNAAFIYRMIRPSRVAHSGGLFYQPPQDPSHVVHNYPSYADLTCNMTTCALQPECQRTNFKTAGNSQSRLTAQRIGTWVYWKLARNLKQQYSTCLDSLDLCAQFWVDGSRGPSTLRRLDRWYTWVPNAHGKLQPLCIFFTA